MTSKLLEKLRNSKRYRDLFVEGQIKTGIPFQIRVMRESRPLTQTQLGDLADMPQTVISRMEKPGSGSLTIKTLLRLASAFDVALVVRFAPFSEIIDWANSKPHTVPGLSQDYLAVPCFSEDKQLKENINEAVDELDSTGTVLLHSESSAQGDSPPHLRIIRSSSTFPSQRGFALGRPQAVTARMGDSTEGGTNYFSDHIPQRIANA